MFNSLPTQINWSSLAAQHRFKWFTSWTGDSSWFSESKSILKLNGYLALIRLESGNRSGRCNSTPFEPYGTESLLIYFDNVDRNVLKTKPSSELEK